MDDNYEINKGTLAIIPVNEQITQIIEMDENFFVCCSSNKIIETSCRSFGSTYAGNCCWIALNNIAEFKKSNKNTIINFINDKEIEFNISSFVIENQIYKATMLESKLRKLTTN